MGKTKKQEPPEPIAESGSLSSKPFFIFALAGFGVIFFNQEVSRTLSVAAGNITGGHAGHLTVDAGFFLTPLLVLFYALIIWQRVRQNNDRDLSEHHIDTIYFLGFLYTLVSLMVLFYRLQEFPGTPGPGSGLGYSGLPTFETADISVQRLTQITAVPSGTGGVSAPAVRQAFYYVGISVSTSLAGVLLRNMVRGSYLREHPDTSDGRSTAKTLEKSYQLLRTISESFTTSYSETVESIRLFLQEREENSKHLIEKERDYVESIDRFVSTLGGVSGSLTEARERMTAAADDVNGALREQQESTHQLTGVTKQFSHTTETLSKAVRNISLEAEQVPLAEVRGEMERFHGCARELNQVLDSLIEILETKVEQVR